MYLLERLSLVHDHAIFFALSQRGKFMGFLEAISLLFEFSFDDVR
jgi:hypothetical protein